MRRSIAGGRHEGQLVAVTTQRSQDRGRPPHGNPVGPLERVENMPVEAVGSLTVRVSRTREQTDGIEACPSPIRAQQKVLRPLDDSFGGQASQRNEVAKEHIVAVEGLITGVLLKGCPVEALVGNQVAPRTESNALVLPPDLDPTGEPRQFVGPLDFAGPLARSTRGEQVHPLTIEEAQIPGLPIEDHDRVGREPQGPCNLGELVFRFDPIRPRSSRRAQV